MYGVGCRNFEITSLMKTAPCCGSTCRLSAWEVSAQLGGAVIGGSCSLPCSHCCLRVPSTCGVAICML